MPLETAPTGANNAFTRNHTQNATILSGATTSDEVILGGRGVVTIHLPAVTAAYFSYLVKINPGDTAVVLVDDSNSTLTFPRGASATVTTARVYQEPRLSGIYSVQIVSSASQGSDRTIGISARGQNPIPTITDIEATIVSGATITANQGTQGSTASPWFVEPVGTASSGPLMPNPATAAAGDTLPVATRLYNVQLIERGGNTITDIAVAGSLTGAAASIGVQAVSSHTWSATNTFDPMRGNLLTTVAASAARTSTLTSTTQTNYNGAMVHVIIAVTSMASGGLTPVINGIGNLGTSYVLLTGAKITGTGTTVLKIGPGFATSVNASAADMIPRSWNVVVTPDDSTSITYSVEGNVNE